jgi:xanthine dehydrogenase accessory factor
MAAVTDKARLVREAAAGARPVACALLVEIEGSAPLNPGATMLVTGDGAIEGSITGGCVESAVAQEAQAILEGTAPAACFTYGISDELAGTAGLTCGGIVHVFVHALTPDAASAVVAALDAVAAGRPAAIATLLDGPHAGAKLALVDGEPVGSLGGPPLLDRAVARDARGLLDQGVTTIRRYGADGAALGAEVRVHVVSFASPPQMLIFGAVDFSAALAPLAAELGYAVTICDPREAFLRSPRFERSAEVVVGWPDAVYPSRSFGPRDAILVFSHDRRLDEPALHGALATDAGYVGALGSRKTTAERTQRLRDAGLPDEQIARIHGPCGLDIGAATPEETAISILAEIVAARATRPATPLRETRGAIQPRTPVPATTDG